MVTARADAVVQVLRVLALSVWVDLQVRRHPLSATARRLGVRLDESPGDARVGNVFLDRADVRRLRAVGLVYDAWPWRGTCLRRSLVTGRLLCHLHPALRLGVRVDAAGAVRAHAWVELDGITWDVGAPSYRVLGQATLKQGSRPAEAGSTPRADEEAP